MDIKSLNYKAYAERLFDATDGIGTDEDEIYQIAQNMREAIAQGVLAEKFHGSEAVNRQNTLMKEATKYLGDAYAVIAKAKGDESLVKSSGTETVKNIFEEEMSGFDLNLANYLFGVEERRYRTSLLDTAFFENCGIMIAGFGVQVISGIFIPGLGILPFVIALFSAYNVAEHDNWIDEQYETRSPSHIQAGAEYFIA